MVIAGIANHKGKPRIMVITIKARFQLLRLFLSGQAGIKLKPLRPHGLPGIAPFHELP